MHARQRLAPAARCAVRRGPRCRCAGGDRTSSCTALAGVTACDAAVVVTQCGTQLSSASRCRRANGGIPSPRQVERRIKTYSGRSLREWQTLVRTESAFFAARDRYEAGAAFNWATLALDEGFAEGAPEPRGQAHHGVLAERIHATLHRRRIVLDVSAVGVRRRGRHIAPACSIARHAGTAPLACPAKAFQKSNRHSKESPNARDSSTTHRRLAAHAMHAGCPIRDARA